MHDALVSVIIMILIVASCSDMVLLVGLRLSKTGVADEFYCHGDVGQRGLVPQNFILFVT